MTVYVCPIRDIECGDRPQYWCAECQKRALAAQAPQAAEPVALPVVAWIVNVKGGEDFLDWSGPIDGGHPRTPLVRLADAQAAIAPQAPAAQRAPRYISEMGHAAEKYLYRTNRFAHPMPAQFLWEECWNAMIAAALEVSHD